MQIRFLLPPSHRELRRSHITFVEPANLAVMWSYKAACTTVVKWALQHNGVLREALDYSAWVHHYRLRRYQRDARYLDRLKRLTTRNFEIIKIVRDPFERAVSSFLHAYKTGYEDAALSASLGRPIDRRNRFSFREFVGYLEQSDLWRCNAHHRRQLSPVERHVLFDIQPHSVIRIESGLEDALNEVERRRGLPVTDFDDKVFRSEHHTDRSGDADAVADLAHLPIRTLPAAEAFYDVELRERVAKLYAPDLARYGYPAA